MSTPNLPTEPSMNLSAARQAVSDGETNRAMRDAMHDLIKKQILSSLGAPADLYQVQVRSVGTDRYRANVFVGKDVTSARIVNSFFLTADGNGKILSSTPEIVKRY